MDRASTFRWPTSSAHEPIRAYSPGRIGARGSSPVNAWADGSRTRRNGWCAPRWPCSASRGLLQRAHGLVERRTHPDDRRRKLVTLTDAGHNAIETADAILLRPPPAVATLTPDELTQLTKLLTRLLDADAP